MSHQLPDPALPTRRKPCRIGTPVLALPLLLALLTPHVIPQAHAQPASNRPNAVPAKPAKPTDIKKEGGKVFAPGKPPAGDAPGTSGDAVWSIVIIGYPETEEASARTALEKVQTVGKLPDAYLEKRGKTWVVAYGRYTGATDPAAKRDLDRVRTMEIDAARPFEKALLVPPPPEALRGTIAEHDLSRVKQRVGKRARYTLQVAVYERPDGKPPTDKELAEIRSTAEKAAAQLRREGDEAYYYHGPLRSTVTIGVFGDSDVTYQETLPNGDVMTVPAREGFAIKNVRAKYPNNLVNGKGVMTRVRGQKEAKLQPSLLVAIP